jgi:hypothetical protein
VRLAFWPSAVVSSTDSGTVGVLHSSNRVALGILLEVGIARSERVGTSPELDRIEDEAVNEAEADPVNTEDLQDEVDDGVQPLVAKRAIPLVKLVEASVRAIATSEHDDTGAEESTDTFFHFFCSLRICCPNVQKYN